MAKLTAAERTQLLNVLGLPPEATNADAVAAAQRFTPGQTLAWSLPHGVVAIDASKLEELREAARLGDQIAETQRIAGVAATVEAAVRDGRIPPAARRGWVASLTNDPGGAGAAHLARMAKGLVPLAEIGYLADDDTSTEVGEDEQDLVRLRSQPAYKNWEL